MAISFTDNLKIQKKAPNVERDLFNSITDMVAYPEVWLPEVFECNVRDTGKRYRYMSTNEVDETLGKWREVVGGADAELTEDITSVYEVGGVVEGKSFTTGTSIESVIKTILEGDKTKIFYVGVSNTNAISDLAGLTESTATFEITANNQFIVIASDSSNGNLTIKDTAGFDNTSSFAKTTQAIDGNIYNIYISKYKITCADFKYQIVINN